MGMIIHRVGTAAQYASIIEKDTDVLYWVEDEQRLYKGDKLYATGGAATAMLDGLMSAGDKAKLDKLRAGHTMPERIRDYLYYVRYDTYDYEDGYKFMERYSPAPACSALRKGNLIGRNLDLPYTESANFTIETKACNGRHATIGCALPRNDLTDAVAQSGAEVEAYQWLPFVVHDVVNDCGVYASVNVVYAGDRGYTTGTNPGAQRICQLMVPRFVADYADSARVAITLLGGMDIYAPLAELREECHLLICDEQDSYIIEFINNVMVVYSDTDPRYPSFANDKCIMTNFYLNGWNGETKTVCGGYSADDVSATGINTHAIGVERYQKLLAQYDGLQTVDDVCRAMESVRYMRAYDLTESPYWYSEFSGEYPVFGDLTVYSTPEDYAGVVAYAQEAYQRMQRDGVLWITAHTSVYDLGARKLYVYAEEDYTRRFEFRLPAAGSTEDPVWESI